MKDKRGFLVLKKASDHYSQEWVEVNSLESAIALAREDISFVYDKIVVVKAEKVYEIRQENIEETFL